MGRKGSRVIRSLTNMFRLHLKGIRWSLPTQTKDAVSQILNTTRAGSNVKRASQTLSRIQALTHWVICLSRNGKMSVIVPYTAA
jgi:hypothetical protein